MADGDGETDVVDISGNGKGVALNVGVITSPLLSVGYISPDMFGATGGGVVDDTFAIQAAIAYANALGFGSIKFTPGKTYKVSPFAITVDDLIIDAKGATITCATVASTYLISLNGDRITIDGGSWILNSSGSGEPWIFNIFGEKCKVINVERAAKVPDAGGYYIYVHYVSNGFELSNSYFEGSNGFYVEAPNSRYKDNVIVGRTIGGDDCFAIKAINGSPYNILISGNLIINLSSGLSVGSEIGTFGANDPTPYSKSVKDIVFVNNILTDCYGIAFIKVGAIAGAGADYRDGSAENIVISNNVLEDTTGFKFDRAITISAARGGRVLGVHGKNNIVRARCKAGGGRRVGLDIINLNIAGGTNEPKIEDVDVELNYYDPWEGVANGVGGAPGHPITHIVSVSNELSTIGTMRNININVEGRGSVEAGAFVGAELDSVVHLNKLRIDKVNTSNAVGQGGIYLRSKVTATHGGTKVVPASGPEISIADTGLLIREIPEFVGVMVKKAIDETANYSTTTPVPWTAEEYKDVTAMHDNSTNNVRLVLPDLLQTYGRRAKKVFIRGYLSVAGLTAGDPLSLTINKGIGGGAAGAAVGIPFIQTPVPTGSTTVGIEAVAQDVPTIGDGTEHFELMFDAGTDVSCTIQANRSCFQYKVTDWHD